MVKLEMVIADAVFGSVTAYGPAEVDIGGVLIVSEEERVGTLRVAEWGKASACIVGVGVAERECRLADIVWTDSVRPGDA